MTQQKARDYLPRERVARVMAPPEHVSTPPTEPEGQGELLTYLLGILLADEVL